MSGKTAKGMPNYFALFIDVMGIKQLLEPARPNTEERFSSCQELLEDFHTDLAQTIEQSRWFRMGKESPNSQPAMPLTFVAEFSDSAYFVSQSFATVATAGITMIRKATRHKYPLRGGLGAGTFSHETSGVRTGRDDLIWSTSSFLGGAAVTAYQAERCSTLGLRIFVHERAIQHTAKPIITSFTAELTPEESADNCTHELRLWRAEEVEPALKHLVELRDSRTLTPRARHHYDVTDLAYRRFEKIPDDLPRITPAIWL